MPWPILMIAQNILAAVFAIQSRKIARIYRHSSLAFNLIVYMTIAATGWLVASVGYGGKVDMLVFGQFPWFFIIAGLCFAATNILSYIVFEHVDAAVGTLLSVLNVISAVILSSILIKESLTLVQLFGGLIIIVSMLMVLTIRLSRNKHDRLVYAVALSILASIFFAVAITIEKHLLNNMSLGSYLVFGWSAQLIGVGVVFFIASRFINTRTELLSSISFIRFAFPAAIIRTFSGLLFIISLIAADNLALISVWSGLKVVIAAVLAIYLLKEKDHINRKLKAAVLAAIGIALLLGG
jgi:drug/metabolite transporter (DMT)-like permease